MAKIPREKFIPNNNYGRHRTAKEVDKQLDHVDEERIRRQGHGLTTEDHDWHYSYLHEVRGRFN